MAFVKFEGRIGRGASVIPALTVGKSSILGINKAAVQKFALRSFKYAILFYDDEQKAIGLTPTNDQDEATCTLRDRESGMDISALQFLEYFEIDHTETRRYPLKRSKDSDMLVAQLDA